MVGWMKGWMEECGRVEQCWSNRRLVESKGVSWLRAAGSVEGHWLDEQRAHEGRKHPAKSEGTCTHLNGLGVLFQPLINLGDGQGRLGPLHTVTGERRVLAQGPALSFCASL